LKWVSFLCVFILNLNLSLNLIICILAILKGFPQNVNPSTPRRIAS
jgi:hypothetical protein